MRAIMKVSVMWTLGLAVLLGSTGVALALAKFQQGKTYCQCSCRSATGFADLTWEKVASCNINGKSCSFNDPYNQNKLTAGKLDSCMSCQADKEGELLCTADSRTAVPGVRISPDRLYRELKTPVPRGVDGPSIEGEQNVEQLPTEQPSGK